MPPNFPLIFYGTTYEASNDTTMYTTFFYQSLNRNCKGVYENVDPRNTKCLELVAEYHKVNTMNFNHFLRGTNYTNINSNLFLTTCSALTK